MPVLSDERVTIKRFVVYTKADNPNVFTVFVSDLPRIIEDFENPKGYNKPTEFEMEKFSIRRALFIEQAIQEKLDRERGKE